MKTLFAILLAFITITASCQSVGRRDLGKMYLKTINKDSSKCEVVHAVLFAHQEILCLSHAYKSCYVITEENHSEFYTYSLKGLGHDGYEYSINVVDDEKGFLMMISNLDGGFPSYVVSSKQCQGFKPFR